MRDDKLALPYSPADEKVIWLALMRAPKMTAWRFWQLCRHTSLSQLFADPPRWAAQLGASSMGSQYTLAIRHYLKSPDWQGVAQDIAWEQSHDRHHILPFYDARYPLALRHIADPPPVLFVQGACAALNQQQIGMVGSRKATPPGREIASRFAHALTQKGYVITSGLAVGIDAAAHQGALSATGRTIAVLGTGPDRVYPTENRRLFQRILENQGAIVSAYPVGVPVYPYYFRARNRIISGMSRGVLVVEAGLSSGALTTAKFAAEQGREVFAVPGSLDHVLSQGCHALLKIGAKLTESIADVLEELMDYPDTHPKSARFILDKEAYKLLECVGFAPTMLDQIQARSGLCMQGVINHVLCLADQGYIVAATGGYMRTKSCVGACVRPHDR